MRSLLASLLCLWATASSAESEAAESLREWLQEAPTVVRGQEGTPYLGSTPETAAYRYTPFTVTEVLKGTVSGKTVLIRDPSDAPVSKPAGEEIVLLEDTADEALGYASSGRYQVRDGLVQVNAAGLDADSVSAKDKHRHAPNTGMPLEEFRRITAQTKPVVLSVPAPKAAPAPRVESEETKLAPPPRSQAAPPLPEPMPDEHHGSAWAAVALGLFVVAALLGVAWKRRRYSDEK